MTNSRMDVDLDVTVKSISPNRGDLINVKGQSIADENTYSSTIRRSWPTPNDSKWTCDPTTMVECLKMHLNECVMYVIDTRIFLPLLNNSCINAFQKNTEM